MRTRRRRHGFTLAEVMVTAGILPVLLGAVYMGFSLGMTYFSQSQAMGRVQQEAMSGMDAMVKELSAATITRCRFNSGALWFASASAPGASSGSYTLDSSTGLTLWQKWVGYLPDSSATSLIRCEAALDSPVVVSGLADAMPIPSLSLFQATPAQSQRVIASDLESFSAQVGIDSVQLTLVLSVNPGTSQSTRFELDDQVHLIN